MNFLNIEDAVEGSIVPIYINNKLESYAKLIKPDGDLLTFINPEDQDHVYCNRRWLIEWPNPDDIPFEMSRELLWTQRSLVSMRTHRNIICRLNVSWDEFVQLNQNSNNNLYL